MRIINAKAIILVIIAIQVGVLCGFANSPRFQSGEQKQLIEKFGKNATAVIAGKVSWAEHDMKRTTVQVYKDENLKEQYCSGIITSKDGSYEIKVEPGQYYILAFVDENQNGRFDLGDGMGIYGITDWDDRSQRRDAVKVAENETKSGVDIGITAMIIEVDRQNQIVPADSEYVKQSNKFRLELDKMFTGISGKLIWPGHKLENALVFAYTDLTWKYRVATAECDENSNFKLNLLHGKYYLLAVIDENQTNLFDQGDKFGIYGMTDLSSSCPQPVLLERNKFASEIEISIVGIQDKSGKIVSLSEQKEMEIGSRALREVKRSSYALGDATRAHKKVELSGKIIWQGHDLKNAVVFAYKDPTLMTSVEHAEAEADGTFKLELTPGKYFLVVNVDINGDEKCSAGDGIGGYGTDNITRKHPAEFVLSDDGASDIEISITAKYDKNGQLVAISTGISPELEKIISSGISGRIIWDGHDFSSALLVISGASDFNSPVFVPIETEEDGSYILSLNLGDYYVMAVVDTNGDNVAGVKDGIGIYGTRLPTQNSPQLVSVFENRITPYIDIEIGGIYIDEQNIAQIDDGHRSDIRKQHGEPEDIFRFSRFGRQIEEWWYWAQGVMFAFEEVGAGWQLDNREEFEPRSPPPESRKAGKPENGKTRVTSEKVKSEKNNHLSISNQQSPSGPTPDLPTRKGDPTRGEVISNLSGALIYYSYDDIVWGAAPNGMHQPIGVGKCSTVSGNGVVLSLIDTDGNIHLIDLENEQDGILLKRSEMASSPSISPDGEYLAFVRKTINRSQIFIKHISTGEEFPVPSTSVQADTPAWNSDGRAIAYAASGNIENPNNEENWNIYAYDLETQRIDAISVTNEDESEPAWSPTEYNALAFSRSEGNHRQIWLVTIDQDGNPTEQQLTESGGRDPAWLPDRSSIIYENNGQLWIVDVEGQNERPLLIDNKPVFGLDPFVGTQ